VIVVKRSLLIVAVGDVQVLENVIKWKHIFYFVFFFIFKFFAKVLNDFIFPLFVIGHFENYIPFWCKKDISELRAHLNRHKSSLPNKFSHCLQWTNILFTVLDHMIKILNVFLLLANVINYSHLNGYKITID
jgi:hypothetical protein